MCRHKLLRITKIQLVICEVVPRIALVTWGTYNLFMHYVYILKLKNGDYYSGHSDNLKGRIKEHNHGLVRATKNFRPISLTFYCAFNSKSKAVAFEKYLKSSSGFAFRNKRLV